jgi:hypothetical protein
MNDELKSPPREMDHAGGQHAKRGGSGFAISAAKRRKRRKKRGVNYALSRIGEGSNPGPQTSNIQHRKPRTKPPRATSKPPQSVLIAKG